MADTNNSPALKNDSVSFCERRWNKLRKEWKKVKTDPSPKQVHDLRVSVRRFLSVMDVYQFLDGRLKTRKSREWLKQVLSVSGPLRDVQVERDVLSELVRDHPVLKAFEDRLAAQEAKGVKKLRKLLKANPKISSDVVKMKDRMRKG